MKRISAATGTGAAIFISGVLLGLAAAVPFSDNGPPDHEKIEEVRIGGYKFINPLLQCEQSRNMGGREFAELEERLRLFTHEAIDQKSASHISVYYRDLNSGPWFGINEHADFCPASLLKVPVMILYFKMAEDDPSILSRKITYRPPEQDVQSPVRVTTDLVPGQSYSVEQYIERMIVNSDNEALRMLELENNMRRSLVDGISVALGIQVPTESTPDDFISVKAYASFFRILFNSSYLGREKSETALKILSRSTFTQGLAAGVPADMIISHKFGQSRAPGGTVQLHDCGIVYYPDHPYLLCVMTRGEDFSGLTGVIRNISGLVFDGVQQRHQQGIANARNGRQPQ